MFQAEEKDLFEISFINLPLPEKAQIFPSRTCQQCGEKMMEPKAMVTDSGKVLCIPCYEKR